MDFKIAHAGLLPVQHFPQYAVAEHQHGIGGVRAVFEQAFAVEAAVQGETGGADGEDDAVVARQHGLRFGVLTDDVVEYGKCRHIVFCLSRPSERLGSVRALLSDGLIVCAVSRCVSLSVRRFFRRPQTARAGRVFYPAVSASCNIAEKSPYRVCTVLPRPPPSANCGTGRPSLAASAA